MRTFIKLSTFILCLFVLTGPFVRRAEPDAPEGKPAEEYNWLELRDKLSKLSCIDDQISFELTLNQIAMKHFRCTFHPFSKGKYTSNIGKHMQYNVADDGTVEIERNTVREDNEKYIPGRGLLNTEVLLSQKVPAIAVIYCDGKVENISPKSNKEITRVLIFTKEDSIILDMKKKIMSWEDVDNVAE